MRIDKLINKRKRFRKKLFLMIFPDRAMAGGRQVDPETFKAEYAEEIEQLDRQGRSWCIDVSNPQGAKPVAL